MLNPPVWCAPPPLPLLAAPTASLVSTLVFPATGSVFAEACVRCPIRWSPSEGLLDPPDSNHHYRGTFVPGKDVRVAWQARTLLYGWSDERPRTCGMGKPQSQRNRARITARPLAPVSLPSASLTALRRFRPLTFRRPFASSFVVQTALLWEGSVKRLSEHNARQNMTMFHNSRATLVDRWHGHPGFALRDATVQNPDGTQGQQRTPDLDWDFNVSAGRSRSALLRCGRAEACSLRAEAPCAVC